MKFSRLFLDTSYILALLNPCDTYHKKAMELFPCLKTTREVLVTEAVFTEVGNALSRSNRLGAINFINSCYVTSNIKVVSVDKELFSRARELYHSHKDKDWGLTDCISFIVMQDYGISKALTTDKHFEQAGFQALLRENL